MSIREKALIYAYKPREPNSQVWDFAGHSEKLAGWMLNLDRVEAQWLAENPKTLNP